MLLNKGAVPAWAGHTDAVPEVDVLNFALTLVYLEATFYTEALGGPGTTGVPATSERSRRSRDGDRLDDDDRHRHHHHRANAPFNGNWHQVVRGSYGSRHRGDDDPTGCSN